MQFQLTTQKSESPSEQRAFDKKLKEDLNKAKENFEEYGYSNKLLFFYSYKLTNKVIRDYEKLAFKDYGLELDFYDANRISEEAESIIELQRLLYEFSGLQNFNLKSDSFDKQEENLVFDLLTFGKPSEFRNQVIEGFILQSIYFAESLSREQIVALCEKTFGVKENDVFYASLFGNLQTNKKITKNREKTSYILPYETKVLVKKKIDQHKLDETVFLNGLSAILKKHQQIEHLDEYVSHLKELYTNNFDSDLRSLVDNANNEPLFARSKEFLVFIRSNISEPNRDKDLAKELISYCVESKYVQKVSASKVYCKNINNSKLQAYLSTKKKIFIDASIGINAICLFYKPNVKYDNYFFRMTKSLLTFCQKEKLPLFIPERYLWEVQSHIREAFKILPFTKLPNFSHLGSSRNVFYNFYLNLIETGQLETKKYFAAFLEEFGFHESDSTNSINSKIESYLKNLGISNYINAKEYSIDDANRLFENEALNSFRPKSAWVRSNDCIMLEFLGDNDVEVHPLQPIFVTWDKSFYEVQKAYNKQFPNSQKWLMLPPSKLVDAYAMLKFSINTETVSESMLALVSDDLFSNTHSLIDTIKIILNADNEVGLEYTNKLAKIRKREIDDINSSKVVPPENIGSEAVIDEVLFNLSNHYQDESAVRFELFKKIFTKKELFDDVIHVIEFAVDSFYSTNVFDKAIFTKFDEFVNVVKVDIAAHDIKSSDG